MSEVQREELAEGRDHLTVTGTFQSDKYPWCPAGFVPLKLTDPAARDLLYEYARRRGAIDSEFERDLNEALANVPEKPNAGYAPFETVVQAVVKAVVSEIAKGARRDGDRPPLFAEDSKSEPNDE